MSGESSRDRQLTIGVLALQGAYDMHAAMLRKLGVRATLVRLPEQLAQIDGIILPGGESTTFLKHLERDGFFDALNAFVHEKPAFGTCAGCVLLAKDVERPPQRSFGALDIGVERNAYGRQIDSRILTETTSLPGPPMEMVFIRAPRIIRRGSDVEVIAERDGSPVLVRQGNLLAATFHPELSTDLRVHELFVKLVRESLAYDVDHSEQSDAGDAVRLHR